MKNAEKQKKKIFIKRQNYKNLPARLFFEKERRVIFQSEVSCSMNILQPPVIKKKNNVFSQLKPIYFNEGTHNINKNKENGQFKYLDVNFSDLFLGPVRSKPRKENLKVSGIENISPTKNNEKVGTFRRRKRNVCLDPTYSSILSIKFITNPNFFLEELHNAKVLKFRFKKHHLLTYYKRYQEFIHSIKKESSCDVLSFYYPVTDDIYMFKSLICTQAPSHENQTNARESFLKAIDAQRKNSYKSAVDNFKSVLALNSEQFCVDSSFVYNNMGYCEFMLGNYSVSADYHMKSLAYFDESQHHVALYNISRAYFFMSDNKNSELYALEALRKAKEVDDKDAIDFLYLQLAYLLFCQNKLKEAICLFEVK